MRKMESTQEEKPSSQRIADSMEGIAEQIKIASKTIRDQPKDVEKMITMLMKARNSERKVFILADGRSGRMSQAFAIRLMHLDFIVHVMLADTVVPRVNSGDVVVVVSGSGTTNTVLAKLQTIIEKKIEAKIIVITSHPKSPTGKWGNLVIKLPGRDDVSIPSVDKEKPPLSPLGSRFEINALAFLEALIRELMRITETTEKEMSERHEI